MKGPPNLVALLFFELLWRMVLSHRGLTLAQENRRQSRCQILSAKREISLLIPLQAFIQRDLATLLYFNNAMNSLVS